MTTKRAKYWVIKTRDRFTATPYWFVRMDDRHLVFSSDKNEAEKFRFRDDAVYVLKHRLGYGIIERITEPVR